MTTMKKKKKKKKMMMMMMMRVMARAVVRMTVGVMTIQFPVPSLLEEDVVIPLYKHARSHFPPRTKGHQGFHRGKIVSASDDNGGGGGFADRALSRCACPRVRV